MGRPDEDQVYHEQQSLQLCALHVLNNIFQKKKFSKADLDRICEELSPGWINPHRSLLGLGNFDVNVIMSALQKEGYEAKWFDKRQPIDSLILNNIYGLILNAPSNYKMLGIVPLPGFSRKHWIAFKKIGSAFYNLDSNLKKPQRFESESDFLNFVQNEVKSGDKELLVVVNKDIAETGAWKMTANGPMTVNLPHDE